jgi:hypothetical protein
MKSRRNDLMDYMVANHRVALMPVEGSERPDLVMFAAPRLGARAPENRAIITNKEDFLLERDFAFLLE